MANNNDKNVMPPMRPPGRGGGHSGARFTGGEKAKNSKGTIVRIAKYLKGHEKSLTLVFVLVVVSTLASLGSTYLLSPIIDEIAKADPNKAFMYKLMFVLALLYIIYAVSQWLSGRILAVVAQLAVKDIRKELFFKMELLPIRFFDTNTRGDLMSRMTNDVDTINQTLSTTISQLFSGILNIFGTLAIMIYISPILTLIALTTIPIMLFVVKGIATFTSKKYKLQQKTLGELNAHIEESVTGAYAIKAFCREEETKKTFTKYDKEYFSHAVWAQSISGLMGPVMGMINNLTYAIVACFGGLFVTNSVFGLEPLSIGSVVVFTTFATHFARPINEIANLFANIQSALAGAERVFEIMDTQNEYESEADLPELPKIKGLVEIKNVTFAYRKEHTILKNVSLYAKPGQTVALVGPTGAGKTTIVNLLTRFYDIKEGEILIDGINIFSVKKDSLREKIGIVLQDTHMFGETVRENIRYGNTNATDEDVERAARLSNAHEFIIRLKDGYDTVLTDDAGNISQGQRQLLSIARAMLKDPEILILDEATSSVDTRTEVKIQEAMKKLMKGRTSFVIAHRLSTIREADLIAVIEDGRITEKGSHKELVDKNGTYARLYEFNVSEKQPK